MPRWWCIIIFPLPRSGFVWEFPRLSLVVSNLVVCIFFVDALLRPFAYLHLRFFFSGRCKVLFNIFERLIFLLAYSVHFVSRRLWAICTESQRSHPNRWRTNVQSMRVKKSDTLKNIGTLHFLEFCALLLRSGRPASE